MQQENFHIGQHIRQILRLQGVTVTTLAEQIHTTRTNMHKILNKENIDVELLKSISKALNHDFFKDISDNGLL